MSTEPFSYRRRVAFGECDPARIYYAPRAVDYAVEAVEAWYESVLGVSWADLVDRHGLEATFLRVECRFLRPLVAGQGIRVRVRVAGTGHSEITFHAAGDDASGEPCFHVALVACFVERKHGASIPIPPEHLEKIRTYQAQRGERDTSRNGDHRKDAVSSGSGGNSRRDAVNRFRPRLGRPDDAAPFTRQRRVVYGDCGASGKIYPPKVFDFVVEAIGEWFEEIPGISWLELVSTRKQGFPWVSAQCEYLRPLVPGQAITMVVRVTRLGRTSIGFAVSGHAPDRMTCFEAHLTACFIDQESGFRPMPIPEVFRGRIQAYRTACEAGG